MGRLNRPPLYFLMKIIKFLVKRVLLGVLVLVGLSIIIFMLFQIMPGQPEKMVLGARASEEALQRLRETMHLDDPLYLRYYYWGKGVLHGDLGYSLFSRRLVADDIREYLPASLELVLYASIFMGIGGLIFGVLSGWYYNTWIDNIVRVISYIGVCLPPFVVAIFLVLVFCYFTSIFPTMGRLSSSVQPPPSITGLITIDALITGNFPAFFSAMKHLLLPSISLALGGLATEARLTRTSIVDNLNKDFIANAKACGIPEKLIMFKYILKPSIIPTLAVFGADSACIIGNSFLVESIFHWPGLSRYAMNAMLRQDLNAISSTVLVYGVIFVIFNLIVDLIVSFLDPTIIYERGQ